MDSDDEVVQILSAGVFLKVEEGTDLISFKNPPCKNVTTPNISDLFMFPRWKRQLNLLICWERVSDQVLKNSCYPDT